jgi:hypothetical protein
MLPIETQERSVEKPLEEIQNTETPNYRISFGTFVLRVPSSSD